MVNAIIRIKNRSGKVVAMATMSWGLQCWEKFVSGVIEVQDVMLQHADEQGGECNAHVSLSTNDISSWKETDNV